MFAAVVLVVLQAGPELRLEDCPAAWVDVRLVKAQLALEPTLPEGVVTGRCGEGASVRLEFGGAVRELTLSGASAGQRERTLALFIATWLARPREVDAGVARGRARGLSDAGIGVSAGDARTAARSGDAKSTGDAGSSASAGDARTAASTRDAKSIGDAGSGASPGEARTATRLSDAKGTGDAGSGAFAGDARTATRSSDASTSAGDAQTAASSSNAGTSAGDARTATNSRNAATRGGDARTATSSRDAGTSAEDARIATSSRDAGISASDARTAASSSDAEASGGDTRSATGSSDAGISDLRAEAIDAGAIAAADAPLSPAETEVPIELAVVPGVGINRLFAPPTVNYLALGLLGVSSPRLDGLSVGPLSLVDTRTRGAQFGLYTRARELQGLQLGVVTNSDTMQGVQLGLASVSEHARGFQLGGIIASASKDMVGVQVGFGLNRARASMLGVQLGTLNVTESLEGVQFGLINVADDLTGLQLGLVNVARTVKGTQIGLVNFSSNGPAPVGIFNVTDDAPMRLALTLGDTHLLNVALKSGGTRFYGLLSLGWVPRAAIRAGGGFGVHFNKVDKLGWFFQLELTSHAILNLEAPSAGFIASLGIGTNVGYRIGPHVAFILGPQFNLLFGRPSFPGKSASLFGFAANDTGLGVAPGLQFGVEL